MADTTQQLVTNEWLKISDSDCTLQSPIKGDFYNVCVGEAVPTDAFLVLRLDDQPVTFAYKSPVWVRLNDTDAADHELTLVVVK